MGFTISNDNYELTPQFFKSPRHPIKDEEGDKGGWNLANPQKNSQKRGSKSNTFFHGFGLTIPDDDKGESGGRTKKALQAKQMIKIVTRHYTPSSSFP